MGWLWGNFPHKVIGNDGTANILLKSFVGGVCLGGAHMAKSRTAGSYIHHNSVMGLSVYTEKVPWGCHDTELDLPPRSGLDEVFRGLGRTFSSSNQCAPPFCVFLLQDTGSVGIADSFTLTCLVPAP